MKTIKELKAIYEKIKGSYYVGHKNSIYIKIQTLKDVVKLIAEKDEWTYEELKSKIEGK